MLLLTFGFASGVIALATFITLSPSEVWWVRGMDFPRLQVAVLAAFLFVMELFWLDFSQWSSWCVVALTLASGLFQLWWILPYTRCYPREVKTAKQADSQQTITVLASNVLMKNRRAPALLALVRRYQPDILVALETNAWWQAQLDVLESDYPYTMKCPLENRYGMHVYSRLPLHDCAVQFLVEEKIPSMHAQAQLRSGEKIRLHFLHPTPPSPTENDESAERDAELLVVAKTVAETDEPVIVAGDLNDVAWSATTRMFRKISGLLDPRVGRGMFNSFHADYRVIRWPLDHLFHSKHFLLADMRRLPSIGSDHFPMLIKLAYNPAEGRDQDGLEGNASDRQAAEKTIDAKPKESVHQPGR